MTNIIAIANEITAATVETTVAKIKALYLSDETQAHKMFIGVLEAIDAQIIANIDSLKQHLKKLENPEVVDSVPVITPEVVENV